MEIRFIAKHVADTSALNSLLTSQPEPVWRGDDGKECVCHAQWSGPVVRSGLFDRPAEWVTALNLAAVPASIAAGLLTNYLWSLIQRGRGQGSPGQSGSADESKARPLFDDLPNATIVVTLREERIEIDPLRIEYRNLEARVGSLFHGKNAT